MRAFLAASLVFLFLPCFRAPAATVPLTTLSYRADGRLISLSLRVNGSEPTWFVLDSGAHHTVIDPRLANQLRLKVVGKDIAHGTGKGAVEAADLEPVRLSLGTVAWTVSDPLSIDLSSVPIRKDIRGLLGWDVLARYVATINPVTHTFALFDPAHFAAGPQASLPLIVNNRRLYVDATLDVKPGLVVTRRLRIDTGSEDSVGDEIIARSSRVQKTTLGNGLGKNFESVSGVMRAVHLGPFVWTNVWGPASSPTIGMEILRRFIVTFDVPHGRLCLEPTPALSEPVPAPP